MMLATSAKAEMSALTRSIAQGPGEVWQRGDHAAAEAQRCMCQTLRIAHYCLEFWVSPLEAVTHMEVA